MYRCQVNRLSIVAGSSFLLLVLLLCLLVATPLPAKANNDATIVGGLINHDTIWRVADSPYLVTANLLIDTHVVLTVEAGVEVRFGANLAMQVSGALVAQGSASQPITFTAAQTTPQTGDWQGIHLTGSVTSLLEHVVVEYAKAPADGPQYVVDGAVTIKDSLFRHNGGGVRTTAPLALITNNHFYSNTVVIRGVLPIEGTLILATGGNSLIAGNQLRQNEFHFIGSTMQGAEGGIINCGNQGTVTQNTITENHADLPVAFVGVGVTGADSVATENTILHNQGTGLRIGLIWECDNYNQPSAGAWANVVQGNGGMGIWGYTLSSALTIANNQIIGNGGDGIFLRQSDYRLDNNHVISNGGVGLNMIGGAGGITFNRIEENQQGGLLLDGTKPRLTFNNFVANGVYNLKNNNWLDGNHLDAKNNWWGLTESNAIAATIIDWHDDPTVNRVDFEPFLTEEIANLNVLFLPLASR